MTWLKQPLENDDGEGADFIIDARPNLSWVVSVTEIETPNELGDFNLRRRSNAFLALPLVFS